MMKKRIWISLFLSGLLLTGFVGCKKAEEAAKPAEEPQQEAPAADPNACKTVDELKAIPKDPAAPTVEEYLQILSAYSCCEPNEKLELGKGCAAFDAVAALKKENKAKLPQIVKELQTLAKHDSYLVRGYAYRNLGGIMGTSEANIAIAKEAIKTEKEPFALFSLVWGLSNEGNKIPEFGAFLIEMSKHENKIIRKQAAYALGNSWSDKVEGVADALVALMGDSDVDVQKAACSNAYHIDDEKVLNTMTAILADDSKEAIHEECLTGLIKTWHDFPHFKHHSEKGYKATLDYLKRTKGITADSKNHISAAINALVDAPADPAKYKAWAEASPFYKADELIAVLTDVVKTPNKASWMTVNSAVKAIIACGGTPARDAISKVVEALPAELDYAKFLKDTIAKADKDVEKADARLK